VAQAGVIFFLLFLYSIPSFFLPIAQRTGYAAGFALFSGIYLLHELLLSGGAG
jgi:hypothetical protein